MALPHIVHKIEDNDSNDVDALPTDNDQWPAFSDELLDAIAAVLAETAPSCATSGELQSIRRSLNCAVKRICMKRSPNCAVSWQR